MFKVMLTLLSFIKQLIFDKKEEGSIMSLHFNIKKWLLFIVITISVMFNFVSVDRLIAVTDLYIKADEKANQDRLRLNGQVVILEEQLKRSDKYMKSLNSSLVDCIQKK